MFPRGPAVGALLALAALTLCARSLRLSRGHTFPAYDEVAYLDQARDFAGRGGIPASVACYLSGECRDDYRHPLYALLLCPLMDGSPGDFARAKLVSLATALLLVVLVFFLCRPRWGEDAALAAAVAVALSPQTTRLAATVSTDALFTALYFSALAVLASHGRRLRGWAAFGFLAGLSYLAKGNGYFLFCSALLLGLARHRLRFFMRPELYLAAAAFAASASLLLWRNMTVWGEPFRQINNRVVWLDAGQTIFWTLGEIDGIGPLWYFRSHTILQACGRMAAGVELTAWTFLKGLAIGSKSYPSWLLTAAGTALCVVAGASESWRSGRREDVLVPAATGATLFAAFAWATPATGSNLRYVFPIAVSLLPLAARGAGAWVARIGPSGPVRRGLLASAALLCLALLWPSRGGLAVDPRGLWAVPQHWAETSAWLRSHVPAEGFLIDYMSEFSLWDCCRDLRRPYPFASADAEIARYLKVMGIRHVLVDRETARHEPSQSKYGRHDAHGPGSFLGWRRCFHDSLNPSRFLIYSPDCAEPVRIPGASAAGADGKPLPER